MMAAMSATEADPVAVAADPKAVVIEFLAALQRMDLDGALALTTDDLVYQNVPLPPTRSRAAARKLLRTFIHPSAGFEVEMHNIAAEGGVVLTERTDVLIRGRFAASFWVCGTFEVRDGRIAVWRDRFDFADFTFACLKGGARALLSLLRGR
jgi:limonene-1,2-epoxide hydrolase